jgi:DNA-binding HxlR family transcriptional regulator
MTEKRHQYSCAMEAALSIISGKWKLTILNRLLNGPQRYSDIKKMIPAITEKMLTQQLREMEEDGIIKRKIYPVVPPKVEYSFTERGEELTGIFKSLSIWGRNFMPKPDEEEQTIAT